MGERAGGCRRGAEGSKIVRARREWRGEKEMGVRRGVQFTLQALGTREAVRGVSDLLGSATLPLKAESLPLR